jgi:hypothetical protein
VSNLPTHLTRLEERLSHRVSDMRERKFKLFLSKSSNPTQTAEVRNDFQRAEALKKQHLDNLSDRQIESFLFSKIDQSKGNEILNFLCIFDHKNKCRGILSLINKLPLLLDENARHSCQGEDAEDGGTTPFSMIKLTNRSNLKPVLMQSTKEAIKSSTPQSLALDSSYTKRIQSSHNVGDVQTSIEGKTQAN